MKYSEIPDFPFIMGDPEASRFGAGPSAGPPNAFMVNNSTRQIDDESLGYLVEYMELDEFLDECDLRLDANMGDSVTELDIDGFLSTKSDPVPFEIQPNQLSDQVEAQNNIQNSTSENQNTKRRRVSSTSMASNSNSSTGSTTSSVTPSSNLNIKTDFGGISGLRSPGAPTFQEIRQQQQQPQTGSAQQTSQILLPKQQNKKSQVWPNSQTPQPSRIIQPGPSSSPTKQPRKTQRKRQQSAPAPISGSGLQVDSATVANTNISVQTTQTMQQKASIFIVAPPEVPLGTLSPIVQVGAANSANGGSTPTPTTPVTDSYVETKEPNFVIPESPSGKGKRKRKQSISDTMKDDKYWERRRKNNAAAKRSREERLAKEAKIAQQANCLVQENIKLKEELKIAIEENKSLRERLRNYELNDV